MTDLVKVFRGRGTRTTVRAVDGVSFSVAPGETLGIVGESGSGKSTLARVIARLERETSGRVRFDGHDLSALRGRGLRMARRNIQFVFQDPYGSLNPRMRVERIIREPLANFRDRQSASDIDDRVRGVMLACGLDQGLAQRYPHELSGGQRQRVGIARALALDPKLVVLDEPVSSLDVSVQAQILNLLVALRDRLGLTYLFIGHDLSVVRHVSDRIAVMYQGRIVELGPADEVMTNPQHPYTRLLLESIPGEIGQIPAAAETHDLGIDGASNNIISGCPFHPRCPIARLPLCSAQTPALEQKSSPSHQVACHLANADPRQDARQPAAAAQERM